MTPLPPTPQAVTVEVRPDLRRRRALDALIDRVIAKANPTPTALPARDEQLSQPAS